MSLHRVLSKLGDAGIVVVASDSSLDPEMDDVVTLEHGIQIQISENHRPKYTVYSPSKSTPGSFVEMFSSVQKVLDFVKTKLGPQEHLDREDLARLEGERLEQSDALEHHCAHDFDSDD